MKLLRLQPAFTVDLEVDKTTAVARLKEAIARDELRGLAESAGTVFDFKIERSHSRFWSPHLSAQLTELNDGTRLFARFSPRPEVWTLFMAFYFVVAILMSLAMIVGYVQWSLGYPAWSLVGVPAGALVIAALHVGSLIGQGLSADQMELLRSRFDRAIEIAFDEIPAPHRFDESVAMEASSPHP